MRSLGKNDNDRLPAFSPETARIRESDWTIASAGGFDARNAHRLAGLESHVEVRHWAVSIRKADEEAARRPGANHVVVVVDTVFAVFEIEEILHELRGFNVVLQLSPWGYLFNYIKAFSKHPEFVLPDRSDITMSTHCLRAYVQHVTAASQRRGAQLLGTPKHSNEAAAEDQTRIEAADLLQVPRGRITERGVRDNIAAVLQYLAGDASCDATDVEFARAQLWQWLHHETGVLDSGRIITEKLFDEWLSEERQQLQSSVSEHGLQAIELDRAAELLGEITKAETIAPFLPLEAYR